MSCWNSQAPQAKGGFQTPDPSVAGKPGNTAMPPASQPYSATQPGVSGNPNDYRLPGVESPGGNNFVQDPRIASILQARVDAYGGNEAVNNAFSSAVNYTPPTPPTPYVGTTPSGGNPPNGYVNTTPPPAAPPPAAPKPVPAPYTTPVAPPGGYVSTTPKDNLTKPAAAPQMGIGGDQTTPASAPSMGGGGGYVAPSMPAAEVMPVFSKPVFGNAAPSAAGGNPVVSAMMRRFRRDPWSSY